MGQVKTIEVPEKAIHLLKSGWNLEMKILESDIKRFREMISQLEKSHGMDSKIFKQRFEAGQLGDEEWCFDWANYLDILAELLDKKETAESVCL
ncbi:MAG: hypothetical protein ACE5EA_11195 [Nitrospirota bacterium]